MDFKIPKFDELKDRLGMGASETTHSRSSSARSRSSYGHEGEFEDYGEYAYDDSADYAQEKTPSFSAQMPKLISSDDVRAHTQYTPSEPVDDFSSQSTRPNRDFKIISEDSHRSPGVNSLFEPSSSASQAKGTSTGAYAQTASREIPAAGVQATSGAPTASVEGRVTQRSARVVTIIKPETYADAERISKVLKSGDVAVLSLRNTQEALGKRILDFSFGVACALDAQVECVSGHVFAITRGVALSESEISRLKSQGLM